MTSLNPDPHAVLLSSTQCPTDSYPEEQDPPTPFPISPGTVKLGALSPKSIGEKLGSPCRQRLLPGPH
jgi:hypothetical protein